MDNFNFSKELELSILEHRIELLFEYIEESGNPIFFPAILFNETFWLLPSPKRAAIVGSVQAEWIGEEPLNRTYFYSDIFFLELIKTIKLNYFSYMKFSLSALIDVLKAKNKYAITEYQTFGEPVNNNILFRNDFVLKLESQTRSKEQSYTAKIISVKLYSHFFESKSKKALVLIYQFSIEFWEVFFESLKKVDSKRQTSVLKDSEFYFAFINEASLKTFEKLCAENKFLSDTFSEINFKYDVIDFADFNIKDKFDFVICDKVFSVIPNNIFIKFGEHFYTGLNRLIYTDKTDPKEAVEKVSLFNSPVKDSKEIDIYDIANIDTEISWQIFDNQEIIDLVSENQSIVERNYFRFSLVHLRILITLIKALNPDGIIEVLDYCDIGQARGSLGIENDKDGISRMYFDMDLNENILNSFSDISIVTEKNSIAKLIAKEVYRAGPDEQLRLSTILNYSYTNTEKGKELFEIENFDFAKDLEHLTLPLSKYSFLKRKNIMLLGIPTYLYKTGIRKLTEKVRKEEKLIDLLPTSEINYTNQDDYRKEYLVSAMPNILKILERDKDLFTNFDSESSQNEELIEVLKQIRMKKEGFYNFINKYREELIELQKEEKDFFQNIEIRLTK